jgi:MoaA/NifB/PqqE/SkfB family radical SAM enzyme
MRCAFCAFWSDGAPPPEELSLAQIERLSERLSALGSLIISVEGGEPLLRPDLVEIVRALARYHHPVLYSNGWHLDAARITALDRAGLVQLGLSLDFATPEKHDALRLPGSFARVVAAAEEGRRQLGAERVHLMTVLMRENEDELAPLLALSQRLGVRHRVTCLATQGHNRAGGMSPPSPGMGARLLALQKQYPHLVSLRRYLRGLDDYSAGTFSEPCAAGRSGFNINHLGQLNPCIELADVSVGHVLEGPLADKLSALAKRSEIDGCQRCYTLCRGHVQALAHPWDVGALLELLR